MTDIDYGGLVVAMETRGKLKYFLDRETGDVSGYYPQGRPADAPKVAACEAEPLRYLPIPAETPEINLGDRRAFVRSVPDATVKSALEATFSAADAQLAFRGVLRDAGGEEKRWFRFKEARVHERASKWLAQHGLPDFPKPPGS